ncbi:MAG: hypothetical protein PCFJNLEI_02459 [Verrucomicrobiae bacterium]|nr:hypothetical protein [Verrucomicrobiae bacterium]
MSRRYQRHEIAPGKTGNMTPLIDVVMQLILFLMLASAAVRPNQIQLDLPESSSSVKSPEKNILTVTYAVRDGKPDITLEAKPVETLEALGPALQSAGRGSEKPIVNVRIEKTVPYQDVIRVMDVVRDAGFPKFSLLTLLPTRAAR